MSLKQRLIIASALFAAAQAQAAIINFDELNCNYSNARTDYTFAAGYGGLVWNNLECANNTMQDPFGTGQHRWRANASQSGRCAFRAACNAK